VFSIHDMIIGIALFVLIYLVYMYYKGARQYPSQPQNRPAGLGHYQVPRIGAGDNFGNRYLRG